MSSSSSSSKFSSSWEILRFLPEDLLRGAEVVAAELEVEVEGVLGAGLMDAALGAMPWERIMRS